MNTFAARHYLLRLGVTLRTSRLQSDKALSKVRSGWKLAGILIAAVVAGAARLRRRGLQQ